MGFYFSVESCRGCPTGNAIYYIMIFDPRTVPFAFLDNSFDAVLILTMSTPAVTPSDRVLIIGGTGFVGARLIPSW